MATTVGSRRKSSEAKAAVRRTSDILKKFISDESQQFLTVEQIVKALGPTSFGTSLMVFSIPEVLPIPIPGMTVAVVIPTVIISSQLIRGKREIRLPNALLKRSIPRKAFAAAVLGGIGNVRGAMIGGLLLGEAEVLITAIPAVGAQWTDVVSFIVLVLVLVARPTGILGERLGRAA